MNNDNKSNTTLTKLYNLNTLMQHKDITQLSLSINIGVSQETISAYLTGKAKPSVDTLIKLADFFNTTTDYILNRTNHNLRVEDIKPHTMNDDEFNIISSYKKLSKPNQDKVKGYIDSLLDK